MDMQGVVEYVIEQGYLGEIMSDPNMQFGPAAGPFLGPEFLPDRTVESIEYTEEDVRMRPVMANSGTRHNPVQKKQTVIVGARHVRLGHSDIGSDLTASDYDAVVRLLRQADLVGRPPDMAAVAANPVALAEALRLGLEMRKEYERWQCLLHGQVIRRGNDKYLENVLYPVPSGRRYTASHAWSDPTYDPYPDLIAPAQALQAEGWEVNRIVMDSVTVNILALNPKMQARFGRVTVVAGSVVNTPAGRVTFPELGALFQRDGLPAPEQYNRQWRTQTGTGFYFDRGSVFYACTTGRDASIDRGDAEPLTMMNTLGYTGVGPASGQSAPGPVVELFARERKPKNIEGEAYVASLPVLEDPEGLASFTGIS